MNYQAFTNDSLTMMYEGNAAPWRPMMRSNDRAWKSDFAFVRHPNGSCKPLNSRRKCWRGMFFAVIDWSEDQTVLPIEE
jgi:hypothetical protein